MKYPITPEYLTNVPDPLVKLFGDLESFILEDICRRFKLSGEATESAIAQIKILQERGADLSDIEKEIRKALKLSEKELEDIFDRAVDRNRQYYDELIKKSDIVSADFKGMEREVAIIQRQTRDEFVNLTQSLGFAIRVGQNVEFLPIAKTYQKVLDDAAAQVFSGAIDYNTAIKSAVKRLTDSGLQMVDYASGWHNRVDVAARRAVMTGVSQLSAQYAEQASEVLETDLREVTAHQGARDTGTGWQNHKAWQGKVYSLRFGDKYPSIYEVCGWGMVDGLEGANCRHHHFPFVEGVSERTYTDEQLASIDPPPFEYQGKTYTAYEATQKQRQIEAAMRKYKREFIGYETAGQSEAAQDSAIKLGRLSKEYKAFSKAAGLPLQTERMNVYTKPNTLAKSTKNVILNTKQTNRKIGASLEVINPMDVGEYNRIKNALEKQGVEVFAAVDGDDLRYMKMLQAEGTYSNGRITHIGEVPSRGTLFEEIIHRTQAVRYGELDSTDFVELCAREVEANRQLLKYQKEYRIDPIDIKEIEENLAKWENDFKRLTGVSYNESNYRGSV